MAFTSAVMSLWPGSARVEAPSTEDLHASSYAPVSNFTATEKQAIIDDLQLEISKRARGLRTIYNEQARQLRESLERRIIRINPRMRSKTMGELVDEQARKAAAVKTATPRARPTPRPPKRTSHVAFGVEDKENAQQVGYPDLDYQKKRPKMAQSQSPAKANVLSPRSHNSRTYTSKMASPEKPAPKARTTTVAAAKARPVSRAVSRPATATARKPATKKAAETEVSRDSDGSSASARTTIVKPSAAKKPATTRKPAVKATTTTAKKRAPAAKTETAPAPTRILRKRN